MEKRKTCIYLASFLRKKRNNKGIKKRQSGVIGVFILKPMNSYMKDVHVIYDCVWSGVLPWAPGWGDFFLCGLILR